MLISIQYLRALAAMLVVFYHLLIHLERHGSGVLHIKAAVGQAGVDIFFVVSGFIMVFISSRKNLSTLDFWRDRVVRVVPLYWFYTSAMIAIAYFLPSVLYTAVFDPVHSFKSLLFIPVFHPNESARIWPILVQGWTLNYEMFFYFIFGLILLFSARVHRIVALTSIFAILIAAGIFLNPSDAVIVVYTNTLLAEFLFGCIFGYFYARGQYPDKKLGGLLFFIGIFGLLLSVIEPGWGTVRAVTWGVPALFLLLGAVSIEKGWGIPHSVFLKYIGDSSYSLYLVHTFVLGLVGYIWGKMWVSNLLVDVVFIFFAFASSLIAGMISYSFIEKPMISYLKKVGKREH